jgi:hypothetical protein
MCMEDDTEIHAFSNSASAKGKRNITLQSLHLRQEPPVSNGKHFDN